MTIGIHGMPVGKDKIEVKTTQLDLDEAYRRWKEKEGQESADRRKAKFIPVAYLPEEPTYVKGKKHSLFINPKTKEMWYEQKDRPISSEEAMSDLATALASQNAEMSAKLDQLVALQTEANNLTKGV